MRIGLKLKFEIASALCILGLAGVSAQPLNDNFAQRLDLPPALPAILEADNVGATAEPGEPSHGLANAMHSVWWRWVAPTNGELRIQGDSYYDPVVAALYTGSTLDALLPVSLDPAHGLWNVEAGHTYEWAVDITTERRFQLRLRLFVTPPNDAFAARAPLPALPFEGTSDLAVATHEAGEPPSPSLASFNIWFNWTAPSDGRLHLKTEHSFVSFDAFSGETLESLTPVPVAYINYEYVFEAHAGVTYQIAMGRRQLAGAFDEFAGVLWTARFDPVPANGSVQTRLPLTGTAGDLIADGHLIPDHRLWYEWTAPGDGTLVLGNAAAYFGEDPARLAALADLGSGIAVTQGMSIKMSVFAPTATPVTYRFYELPSNDFFANARIIDGRSVHLMEYNYGAGLETHEPKHGRSFAGRSIWYRWTAPATGWATWHVETPGRTPATKVYEGSSLSRLKPVKNQSQIVSPEGLFEFYEFQAVAGKTYAFVVDNQRTPAEEGGGYSVNPASTFDMQFTFTTLRLEASLFAESDGSPLFVAGFQGDSDITGGQFSLVQLDRFCPNLTIPSNGEAGALLWTNPPPGRFLLTAAVSQNSGDTVIVSPVTVRIPPANDNLSHAEPLQGYQLTHRSSIAGSTREPGEPSHGGGKGLGSIWWKWTAPVSGPVDLGVTVYGQKYGLEPSTQTGISPSLAVYRSSKGGLSRIAVGQPKKFTTRTRFHADAQATYFIAGQMPAGYYLSDCAGEAELSLRLAAARVSHALAGATFVHGASIPLAIDSDLPWTDIEHVEYFESFEDYRQPTFVLSSGQAPFNGEWSEAPKGPHHLKAKLFFKDGTTLWTDSIGLFVRTRNDSFAEAIVLTGEEVDIRDDVAYATREPHEPRETGPPYGDSVWYRWTAPRSGRYFARLSGFGESWFLYIGASLKSLRRVMLQSNPGLGVDWFDAVAGTTYQIAIKRAVLWPAPFELTMIPGEPPPNDAFAAAQMLPAGTTTLDATLRLASLEAGEPSIGQDASVWFAWRAPADGMVAFKRPAVIYDVHLFAGNTLSTLQPQTDLGDPDAYVVLVPLPWRYYRVQAEQTYYLQVVRLPGYILSFDPVWDIPATRFQLEWQFAEPPANDSFSNAFELPAGLMSYSGGSLGASSEPDDLMAGLETAVTRWWTWRAPANGILTVSFSNQYVGVFRGETLASLQPVPGSSVFGVSTEVQQGEVLYLCSYHWHPHVELFSFQLVFQATGASRWPQDAEAAPSPIEPAESPLQPSVSTQPAWRVHAAGVSATQLELVVTGEGQHRCVLESSTDLRSWQAIPSSTLVTTSAGELHLTVELESRTACFFRVRAVP